MLQEATTMDSKDDVLLLVGEEQEEAIKNDMSGSREYRKGNWTLAETMVLIEAKKMDNDRRLATMRKSSTGSNAGPSSATRPSPETVMRWKWVEDYCWRQGCSRSQNQCNDRWDNLMRDYKKVRAHELSLGDHGNGEHSYWRLGRVERKERSLPSNLLPEIYEALAEVTETKKSSGCGVVFLGSEEVYDVPMQPSPLAQILPRILDYGSSDQGEQNDMMYSNSPDQRKRRRSSGDQPGSSSNRTRSDQEQQQHGDQGDSDHDLNSSICKCATILSEAVQASEEGEERRHRELMAMEERRTRLQQSKCEVSEQCMAGLATAMNQLANSILALTSASAASHKSPTAPK